MKRAFILILCLSVLLAGCTQPSVDDSAYTYATDTSDVIIESPDDPIYSPDLDQPMHALVTPTVTENFLGEDGVELFSQSYPKFQLILSNRTAQDAIAADLQARLDSFLTGAAQTLKAARQDYSPTESWMPYFCNISYTPTRLDQSILSLSIRSESYSGETHPAVVSESVSYDLTSGKRLILDDILLENWSGEALAELVCEAVADRAEELYAGYENTIRERFTVNGGGNTAWYFTGDGLCFHFSPYDIAPPFAGIVTAVIDYADLNGLLKQEYFPMETDASGILSAEFYTNDGRFPSLVTMSTDPDGTQVLISADAAVAELQIQVGSLSGGAYTAGYTLFTADCLASDIGLVIRTDLTAPDQVLQLTYRTGGKTYTATMICDENGTLQLVYG